MGLLDGTTQAQYYSTGDFGNYQFVTMDSVIAAFMVAYVGEDKIIPKVNKTDVQFHAMRAIQELSYDVFRSIKSHEIEVPPSLKMILPQDYVNYVKLVRVDSAGIERVLYPTGKTSNPFSPQVDGNNDYLFDSNNNTIPSGELIKNGNFHGGTDHWILNQRDLAHGNVQEFTPVTSVETSTFGDPVEGWFYSNNSVTSYGTTQFDSIYSIKQLNVPIRSGEKYKVKFTMSNYSSGNYVLYIVDENGDWAKTSEYNVNGTHEEILTAGANAADYDLGYPDGEWKGGIWIRQVTPDTLGNVTIDNVSVVRVGNESTSKTWNKYSDQTEVDVYSDSTVDADIDYRGRRYGLDPQHAQSNGTFFIDYTKGYIHFGSSLVGDTVTLKYISDGLGTDSEMVVHKFCEEAVYKHIAYAILSTRSNIPEYIVQRYRKERFAATRKAKIRLSNIKIEEFTQVLKGLGKPIK